jgi:hypothetical protein
MNIPNFIDSVLTGKDGKLTSEWRQFLTQLTGQLQKNLSDQTGVIVPQQSTDNITTMGVPENIGSLVYDKSTHELKVNINGTYRTVQLV